MAPQLPLIMLLMVAATVYPARCTTAAECPAPVGLDTSATFKDCQNAADGVFFDALNLTLNGGSKTEYPINIDDPTIAELWIEANGTLKGEAYHRFPNKRTPQNSETANLGR